jgi:hypothetical protein
MTTKTETKVTIEAMAIPKEFFKYAGEIGFTVVTGENSNYIIEYQNNQYCFDSSTGTLYNYTEKKSVKEIIRNSKGAIQYLETFRQFTGKGTSNKKTKTL